MVYIFYVLYRNEMVSVRRNTEILPIANCGVNRRNCGMHGNSTLGATVHIKLLQS